MLCREKEEIAKPPCTQRPHVLSMVTVARRNHHSNGSDIWCRTAEQQLQEQRISSHRFDIRSIKIRAEKFGITDSFLHPSELKHNEIHEISQSFRRASLVQEKQPGCVEHIKRCFWHLLLWMSNWIRFREWMYCAIGGDHKQVECSKIKKKTINVKKKFKQTLYYSRHIEAICMNYLQQEFSPTEEKLCQLMRNKIKHLHCEKQGKRYLIKWYLDFI